MKKNPLKSLLSDIPAEELSKTVDSVMIDYAIASVQDLQTESTDEAVDNIRNLKKLRDALFRVISFKGKDGSALRV